MPMWETEESSSKYPIPMIVQKRKKEDATATASIVLPKNMNQEREGMYQKESRPANPISQAEKKEDIPLQEAQKAKKNKKNSSKTKKVNRDASQKRNKLS